MLQFHVPLIKETECMCTHSQSKPLAVSQPEPAGGAEDDIQQGTSLIELEFLCQSRGPFCWTKEFLAGVRARFHARSPFLPHSHRHFARPLINEQLLPSFPSSPVGAILVW